MNLEEGTLFYVNKDSYVIEKIHDNHVFLLHLDLNYPLFYTKTDFNKFIFDQNIQFLKSSKIGKLLYV